MALINNNFSKDKETRWLRLSSIQDNIDKFAAELGVTGALLDWAQNCETVYNEMREDLRGARYSSLRAFAEHRKKFKELRKKYQSGKDYLKALVRQYDESRGLAESYAIDGRTPKTRAGLGAAVDDLLRQDGIYRAAGDPWVLPASTIARIHTLRTEMGELYGIANNKRKDFHAAVKTYNDYYDSDTHKLRLLFEMALSVWGPDAPKLRLLGFLYRSAIWTKHVPPAPANFRFDSESRLFQWDIIEGADRYEAHYRDVFSKSGEHWTVFYEGVSNSCPPPEGLTGKFDFAVRAIAGKKEGNWCKPSEIFL